MSWEEYLNALEEISFVSYVSEDYAYKEELITSIRTILWERQELLPSQVLQRRKELGITEGLAGFSPLATYLYYISWGVTVTKPYYVYHNVWGQHWFLRSLANPDVIIDVTYDGYPDVTAIPYSQGIESTGDVLKAILDPATLDEANEILYQYRTREQGKRNNATLFKESLPSDTATLNTMFASWDRAKTRADFTRYALQWRGGTITASDASY